MTLMGVLASVNCYTMRVNLSVALVVMVNSTWIASLSEHEPEDEYNFSPCAKNQNLNQTAQPTQQVSVTNTGVVTFR